MEVLDDLSQCLHALGDEGPLAAAFPDFVSRQAQIELAEAVFNAIERQSCLVAEAGTGTGKTWAYLLPCLTSGKKTIVSTATKTLQDQLFYKDLPRLLNALKLPRRIQNLKGRDNYICLHRLELFASQGHFYQQESAQDLLTIKAAVPRLSQGERHELPEIAEDSPVWPYATSTADNCEGSDCEFYNKCFLVKARRRAMKADVVLINHHLFFADSRLKEDGFGELLPGADVVIFDEAHQLIDIATHFFGERLSTKQLQEWIDDTLRSCSPLDSGELRLASRRLDFMDILQQLRVSLSTEQSNRLWLNEAFRKRAFANAWSQLQDQMQVFSEWFESNDIEDAALLDTSKRRFYELQRLLALFDLNSGESICWLERFKRTVVFHATPYSISKSFHTLLTRRPCAYIFTSATLSVSSSFSCFTNSLGLSEVETLRVPSPFDYTQQALLYLPRGMPDPKDVHYYDAFLEKIMPVIDACRGRCFLLFTSHRGLHLVAERLKNKINFPLFIQGEEPKSILLNRFREAGNAILLGTATFWEGVDVKGDALSCVIIDKLPFASPADPVMQGKLANLRSQGRSGFDELTLPNAVIALKQGVGRLIRDVTDSGVLMIADPRLVGRRYSEIIFESLPKMRKTRDEQQALSFIFEHCSSVSLE